MTILIFTPRLRLIGRCLQSVYAAKQAYGKPVHHLEMQHEQPYGTDGPGPAGNNNILHQLAAMRTMMLAGDWSHVLIVEDDMVVPAHAIQSLLDCDAPVAYSLYCWRRGPPHFWSAYHYLFEDGGASWSDDQPHTIAARAQHGDVLDVVGVGLGCTLIRRDVLARVPFRLSDNGMRASVDWYFAVDCQAAQIRQVCNLGVQCGHVIRLPSMRIIWPDPSGQGKHLYRYELCDTGPTA